MREDKDYYDFSKIYLNIKNLFLNKNFQWALVMLFLIILSYAGSEIRTSNLQFLKDQTNGEYIPLALDPFYFIRSAKNLIEYGSFPERDVLRRGGELRSWVNELLPYSIAFFYKVANAFNPGIDFNYIAIITPVIFFVISLFLFFFMTYYFSKSKAAGLIASALLAFSPAFLYRSMAGFVDHDVVGIAAIFLFFIGYLISLKKFEESWAKTAAFSAITGFLISLVLFSWGGLFTFVILIFPISFFFYWVFRKEDVIKSVSFYLLSVFFIFASAFLFGIGAIEIFNRITGSYGVLVPFVGIFCLIDSIIITRFRRYHNYAYSLIATVAAGVLGMILVGRDIHRFFIDVYYKLISPFSLGGRLGRTVAENAQPYLLNWINQNGKIIFWLFLVSIMIFGWKLSLGVRGRKNRYAFFFSWIVLFISVLFSRISNSSLLNGDNFISKFFYISGLLFFIGVFTYLLHKGVFASKKVQVETLILSSIAIVASVYGRSASRILFLIAPFAVMFASISIVEIWGIANRFGSKDKLIKIIAYILVAIVLIALANFTYSNYKISSAQAKSTGPSAHIQWQKAMKWVRENTPNGSIFVHWWDYGYWIQSLGKRPTVTDGGHAGGFNTDHYIGRYILTTPWPKSALSYMKTWNVSYLLIDPTDLGKYSAYSSIGGGEEDPNDRFSAIPTLRLDPRQITEKSNSTLLAYVGGTILFEDIQYDSPNRTPIFLPSGRAGIGGVLIEVSNNGSNSSLGEILGVTAIYVYKNKQYPIPLRYLEIDGKFVDFGKGYPAAIKVIPSFNGETVNRYGAAVYLSKKVLSGLFAQLYLLDDPFNKYPTIKIAHVESDPLVSQIKNYGYDGGEFIFFNGFRGPIKIWRVDYPKDIKTYKEFKENLPVESDGTLLYGRLDEVFGNEA